MITEHTICALPEGNINYRHYAIQVRRRRTDGLWVLHNEGDYLDEDGEWSYLSGASWAAAFDEATALRLAEEWAPKMTCNGFTVAEVLERSRR